MMTSVSRDETFYFAMTIFQVEDCLFKVPRKPFEEQADIFRSMFLLPSGSHAPVEGLSDDKPLILEGVTKKDFRAFLQVLLPPSFGEEMAYTEEEWLSVLSLANMWGFTKIRQTAIEKLQNNNIDLITKIELAHRYDIREWLFGAYLALGKRLEPLTVNEGARLGYDFALKMASVREQLLRDKIAHPNAYRQRPYVPSRGDSPRGSAVQNASSASGRRTTTGGSLRMARFYGAQPAHLFPDGDGEDEDDIVLAKAINEIFGIRGEPHFMFQPDMEQEDLGSHFFVPPFDDHLLG